MFGVLYTYLEKYYLSHYIQKGVVSYLLDNLNNESFWLKVIQSQNVSLLRTNLVKLNKSIYLHEALKCKNIDIVYCLIEQHECPVDKIAILYSIINHQSLLQYLGSKYTCKENIMIGDLLDVMCNDTKYESLPFSFQELEFVLHNIRNETLWLLVISLGHFDLLEKISYFGILLDDSIYIREAFRSERNSSQIISILKDVHKSKIPDHFIIREKPDMSGVVMDIIRHPDKNDFYKSDDSGIFSDKRFLQELITKRRIVIEPSE